MSGADGARPPADLAAEAARCDRRARIRALLDGGDLGAALYAIERLVEEVFCEPLNTAEIFADASLDEACQRAGAASLQALPAPDAAAEPPVPVVFIASRLQGSGGHTAVLADIARISESPVKVLLTGVAGRTDVAGLAHVFAGVRDLSFECAPRRDRGAKLGWLQQRLRALRPKTVWLFNHHQDSVAVAAVQPGQGYSLKFLHHGDHHLCLGVCLRFGEHYDLHAMGWRNCRHALGREGNRYLPMAVDRPVTPPPPARTGPLVTCTAAGRNKIEHAYWPSYDEVVPALLAHTGGSHVHFGRLSPLYLWRIRRALARRGVAPGAFRYVPHVTSVAEGLLKEQVDLYLSSFPYPGARTLVEAMAAGVPIAAHDHSGSGFLGALDMMPAGTFVWSHPQELLAFAASATRPALRRMGELARRHFDDYHTPEAMRAVLQPGADSAPVPPAQFAHRPDPLAQALRRAREFSLSALLGRWVIRTVRRVRSMFS